MKLWVNKCEFYRSRLNTHLDFKLFVTLTLFYQLLQSNESI